MLLFAAAKLRVACDTDAQMILDGILRKATTLAAVFIERSWIQGSALAIQIAGWVWYFARLQTALSD